MSIRKVSVRQVKAARALLGWSQLDLAKASGVSEPTVKRLEAADGDLGGREGTAEALCRALEAAGVILVDQNGDGPGVRLRKVRRFDAKSHTGGHWDIVQSCFVFDPASLPTPPAGLAWEEDRSSNEINATGFHHVLMDIAKRGFALASPRQYRITIDGRNDPETKFFADLDRAKAFAMDYVRSRPESEVAIESYEAPGQIRRTTKLRYEREIGAWVETS
jgi:transcriptional regulator with XRE-family HTH domain